MAKKTVISKKTKAKKLLESKTVWFNVIMGGVEALHAGFAIMKPVLPPDIFAGTMLVVGIVHGAGGIYLRSITSTPIK